MSFSPLASSPVTLGATLLFAALLALAAASDWRSRRIPNRLVIALALSGVACSIATSPSALGALGRSGGGIAVGLALWFPFYALRWMGAGDVKLFAAAGAWLGPERALVGSLLAALLGGLLGALWMLRTHGARDAALRMAVGATVPGLGFAPVDARSQRAIPYGVSLAIGAFAAAWLPPLLHGGSHAAR